MIYDAMAAFYMACASFMSQNYGAGKPDRVKKSYFIALAYSFGAGLVLAVRCSSSAGSSSPSSPPRAPSSTPA